MGKVELCAPFHMVDCIEKSSTLNLINEHDIKVDYLHT